MEKFTIETLKWKSIDCIQSINWYKERSMKQTLLSVKINFDELLDLCKK